MYFDGSWEIDAGGWMLVAGCWMLKVGGEVEV